MRVRRIWEVRQDEREHDLRKGDQVIELEDGRFFIQRPVDGAKIPADLVAEELDSAVVGEMFELESAVREYLLGWENAN